VTAVIESMTGARFVYDQPELRSWTVEIADAVNVKEFAPLAVKPDKIKRVGAGRAVTVRCWPPAPPAIPMGRWTAR
jgi:hypothetical protein